MQIDVCGNFTHNNEYWKHNPTSAGTSIKKLRHVLTLRVSHNTNYQDTT